MAKKQQVILKKVTQQSLAFLGNITCMRNVFPSLKLVKSLDGFLFEMLRNLKRRRALPSRTRHPGRSQKFRSFRLITRSFLCSASLASR